MRSLFCAACAAALMLCSQTAMQACRTSAQVFVSGVMPSLFPMMVVSRMLPAAGGRGAVGTTALFSLLSGSPASAQRAAALMLDKGRLEKLLCLCGVMNPLFFTGTLSAWTQNSAACRRMLFIHWLGAGLTALVWPARKDGKPSVETRQPETASFADAVGGSASAMLAVCGAMMVFSVAAGIIGQLIPMPPKALAVLWAMLEIGGGAKAVIGAFPHPPFALLCALCSFGGLSIWLQNLLFLGKKIRPAKLLCMRALHGAVCYGLCSLISFP